MSFGGHTPFYRLWYEVMPMMKKVRAPGMAFYLVALITCLFAAFGTDRLLQGRVPARSLWIGVGILGGLGLLAAVGALRPVTETLADPRMLETVAANAGELQAGGVRLLIVVALAGAVFWAAGSGRIFGGVAALALGLVTVADGWSIDRLFFDFSPPASVVFADDDLVSAMRAAPAPSRVLDPWGAQVYNHATLMNHKVPQVFGYHGQELRYYDELWGGKGTYTQQVNPNLWDLFAVRFVLLQQEQKVPGLHLVAGPARTAQGATGYLYELDSVPPYARVVASAAKLPDSVIAATVADQRFPVSDIVLLPDTSSASPAPVTPGNLPPRPAVSVKTTMWRPGQLEFEVQGTLADAGVAAGGRVMVQGLDGHGRRQAGAAVSRRSRRDGGAAARRGAQHCVDVPLTVVRAGQVAFTRLAAGGRRGALSFLSPGAGPPMPDRALVIIPTYNEIANLPQIVPAVLLQDPRLEILVVDDNSPDGTGQLADELAAHEPRVHVLHRMSKDGLGRAYIAGFQWALAA